MSDYRVYFNGELVERDEARLDMEDRACQFGDGVYEVIALWGGVPFKLEEHMQRLEMSGRALDMELPPADWFIEEAYSYLEELGCLADGDGEDFKLYVQASRGIADRRHAYPDEMEPEIIMKVSSFQPNPQEYYDKGVSAITYPDERWARCYAKSLQLLPNAMAKKASEKAGAYEAILVRDGFAMEGSLSNIFIVEKGRLITPPASNYILNGITRRTVIELAGRENIPLFQDSIPLDRLFSADEVFLSGTTTEIMPIVEIDDEIIGPGRPGELTLHMQKLYWGESRSS